MYAFAKLRHAEGDNVYGNDNFRRNQHELLPNIKRKVNSSEKPDKLTLYAEESFGKELQDLKNKQRNLETLCKQLINQNRCILEENTIMMKRIKT
jgi:hypothetical protein